MNVITKFLFFTILFHFCTSTGWAQLQQKPKISQESDITDYATYTGVVAEHYANGSPKLWKTVINGKANGLWLEWYPDGTMRYNAYWKDNLGHGRWAYYHPNGQLQSESFYIKDIAQGMYRSYFDNGQLQSDCTYMDNKKEGIELLYDVNGVLSKRNFYKKGQLVIDQPTLFEPGKITDSKSNEWGICFTPDGKTAYFTRRDSRTNEKRIYETVRTDAGWSEPIIAAFSTDEDEAPFVNRDGSKLFFASFRPLPDGGTVQKIDNNLWFMDKTATGWSAPKPIQGPINQSMKADDTWPENYEAGPTTDAAGNLYYWAKGTKTKGTNLYFAPLKADGTYSQAIELIEPSSDKHYDAAPILSPDGKLFFFSSDERPNGLGGTDIFYSKRLKDGWSAPKLFAPFVVNTYGNDGSPSFSPDGKYFFFSSTRAGNKDADGEYLWDLYYMETEFLMIE